MFDPLAGCERLPNGTIVYRVHDKELSIDTSDDTKLRAEWERLKLANSGVLEVSEEDMTELRGALLDEMEQNSPFTEEEFSAVLDKEFSVFKNGEKYDFVRDMKDAFASGLEKPAAERILDTIPEHAFWDIKTPQVQDP